MEVLELTNLVRSVSPDLADAIDGANVPGLVEGLLNGAANTVSGITPNVVGLVKGLV